jgi:hypothetical protein
MPVTVGFDSYADETGLTSYATARGVTITGDKTQLLIKAMDWLEMQSFASSKVSATHPLKWPRFNAEYMWPDYPLDDDGVPLDIVKAQMICALVYDSGGDPIGAISRAVKKEKVDVIEVEYMDGAASQTLYPSLNALISPFLGGGSSGTGFVVSRA